MKPKGFTIVELLIVIVVIAILAAISIVSYNGIQTRASNIATIAAADSYRKIVKIYQSSEGVYRIYDPSIGSVCLGENPDLDNDGVGDCYRDGSVKQNDAVNNLLKKYSELPDQKSMRSVKANDGSVEYFGVSLYQNEDTRTVDGNKTAYLLRYYLKGDQMDCGLRPVLKDVRPTADFDTYYWVSQTDPPYTYSDKPGITSCYIAIPAS